MVHYSVGLPDGTVSTRDSKGHLLQIYTHAVVSQRTSTSAYVVTYHGSLKAASKEVAFRDRHAATAGYRLTHVRPVIAVIKLTDLEQWAVHQDGRLLQQGFFKRIDANAWADEAAKRQVERAAIE